MPILLEGLLRARRETRQSSLMTFQDGGHSAGGGVVVFSGGVCVVF